MTDIALNPAAPASARPARRDIGLKRRYAAERRFKLYGIAAIAIGLFFLVALMYSVFSERLHGLLADRGQSRDQSRPEDHRSRQQACD